MPKVTMRRAGSPAILKQYYTVNVWAAMGLGFRPVVFNWNGAPFCQVEW